MHCAFFSKLGTEYTLKKKKVHYQTKSLYRLPSHNFFPNNLGYILLFVTFKDHFLENLTYNSKAWTLESDKCYPNHLIDLLSFPVKM